MAASATGHPEPAHTLLRLPATPTRTQAELAAEFAAPDRPANLRVATWLPQNDVLAHPALRAFVTQGGFLSMAEAAYHGVPIIGIPLLAGQGELIRFAADQVRGGGQGDWVRLG